MLDPVRVTFYIQIEYQYACRPLPLFCPWKERDWRSYYSTGQDEESAFINVGDDVLSQMFEEAKSECSERSKEEGRLFRLTGRWRVVRRKFYRDIPPIDQEILIGNRNHPRSWMA